LTGSTKTARPVLVSAGLLCADVLNISQKTPFSFEKMGLIAIFVDLGCYFLAAAGALPFLGRLHLPKLPRQILPFFERLSPLPITVLSSIVSGFISI